MVSLSNSTRKPMNDSIVNHYKRLSEVSRQNYSSRLDTSDHQSSNETRSSLMQLVFSDVSDNDDGSDTEDLLGVNATYKKIMAEFSY